MRYAVVLLALAACPRPRGEPTEPQKPPAGDVVPELEIVAPQRGAFVEGGTVVVSGRVRDDGPVRVTVNGVAATVASDGGFTAELAVPRGMTIVETHAIDATGHDVRDVRAVLGGPFATSDGKTRVPIGVQLGRDGLAALAKALASSATATDLAAAAKAIGPVYEKDGCLGARIEIAALTAGKVDVVLAPKMGAIETHVAVDNVVVKLDVRYTVACIARSAALEVRTHVRARGDLAASVSGGAIRTAIAPRVTLEDFQVDLGALPGPIASLLRVGIRAGIERAIAGTLERKLPGLADAKLAELFGRPMVGGVLGKELRIEIVPRHTTLAPSGITAGADVALAVIGGERGRYVAWPPTRKDIASDATGLGVWLGADTVNQLLAGLWAARAFERSVKIADAGALKLLLGSDVQTIELAIALPPTVTAHDALEIAIGDLSITMRDAAGAELQRFAVSARSKLSVDPKDLVLAAGEPTVHAQVISQSATVGKPLDQATVETIVKGAWRLVDGMLGDALARVPIPGFAGLEPRSLIARDGMIVLVVAPKPQ